MSFNPYQPPTSAYDGNYTNPNAGAVVSDRIVAALRKTKPWVTLIAVLFLIAGGLSVLGSLGTMMESFGMGLATLLFSGFYLGYGIVLLRYGKAIDKLLHGGGVSELEEALDAQASFWQLAGILTLVGIVLGILAMIGVIMFSASLMNGF